MSKSLTWYFSCYNESGRPIWHTHEVGFGPEAIEPVGLAIALLNAKGLPIGAAVHLRGRFLGTVDTSDYPGSHSAIVAALP